MPRLIPLRLKTLRQTLAPIRCAAIAALLAVTSFAAPLLHAGQTPGSYKPHAQKTKQMRAAKHAPAQPAAQPAAVPPTASQAPLQAVAAPALPNWPSQQQPQQPHVTWDSHGLKVEASNSSLSQILHEVSTDTGVKVEGFNQDQRIFGTYGPGPAREILSQLLDGSGYNVLMIGGQGDAPPSRIVLSASTLAGSHAPPSVQNPSNDDDVDAEASPEPEPEPQQQPQPQQTPPPAPIRNPFGGSPPMYGQPQAQPEQNNQQPQQQ